MLMQITWGDATGRFATATTLPSGTVPEATFLDGRGGEAGGGKHKYDHGLQITERGAG
jgi:hypothetical protein